MVLSNAVIEQAWRRANAQCECNDRSHGHTIPCSCSLSYTSRGREGQYSWEVYHNGNENHHSIFDCEILCWKCYCNTVLVVD